MSIVFQKDYTIDIDTPIILQVTGIEPHPKSRAPYCRLMLSDGSVESSNFLALGALADSIFEGKLQNCWFVQIKDIVRTSLMNKATPPERFWFKSILVLKIVEKETKLIGSPKLLDCFQPLDTNVLAVYIKLLNCC